MKSIECPYIMTAIDIFEHDNNKCIVMPFAEYNALSYINKILQVSEEPREEIAKRIVKATLEALHFLHSRNICHRDVKTENLLISGNLDVSPSVMLSDLGLAKQIGEGKKCDDEFVGTLKFAAPEIITHTPYDQSADIWSLGVTTYYLLSGTSPFPLSPECCLRRCIEKGAYFYPQRTWKGISEKAKNLIDRMICVDPIKRITAKEALDHPWFDKEE
ncbi:CAMK family protein kinase [Histomonas meleagridis]|uniref:CAMK family protein kinase n=1 Tax=Histomonas meleagridis TaxID=135588 RepID=UPI00355A22CD|nr:CAMK family protein kinase [Histomonas meleagridis]KAH0800960.1 CAMK family protein kinase [Histomonas meleagridis]